MIDGASQATVLCLQVLQGSLQLDAVGEQSMATARAFGEYAWTNGCLAAMRAMMEVWPITPAPQSPDAGPDLMMYTMCPYDA
eukprot:scaffold40333_cov28-Prasinocladus_malaysianus.AAC.2